MSELTLNTIPSGGIVTMDERIIGIAPQVIPIDESRIGLTEFRAECMSGDLVKCTWSNMKTRLEDQTVSSIWWELTRNERYSVAEMAINNTFPYIVHYYRQGYPDCARGIGEFKKVVCVGNAIIRCLKFGKRLSKIPYWRPNADECYYKKELLDEEYCFVPETPYGLPCFYVSHLCSAAHALAAIQIVDSYESIDNWIIFQYNDFDIKPGHRQMPTPARTKFSISHGFQCGVSYGTTVAEFSV